MNKRITFLILGLLLVFYSTSNSGVWQREVVDSSGTDKGQYCSLALDSHNEPHIAYYDNDNFDLRYAYIENGHWVSQIIDSVGYVGLYCSLALDANDRPHIAYQKGLNIVSMTDVGLKYATIKDTGWSKIFLDSLRNGIVDMFCSIAISPDGSIGISYLDIYTQKLKYAHKTGDDWTFVEVDSSILFNAFTDIAFKSDGTPEIGYYDNDEFYVNIANPGANDSTWVITRMPYSCFPMSGRELANLDIDSNDNLHLSFASPDGLFMTKYAFYDWFNWQQDTVFVGGWGTSLKVDKTDVPAILARDFQGNPAFFKKENNQWTFDRFDEDLDFADYSSLQFDNQNLPHLAIGGVTRNTNVDLALLYYRYWPGSPQIVLPESSHNYGAVWTQSYSDWNCPVTNTGEGPLIISELEFQILQTNFEIINPPTPIYIQPSDTAYITIRFHPDAAQNYQVVLNIQSNDSLSPAVSVNLTGQGTSSGATGNLTLVVNNCYYDQANGYLKQDIPLEDCRVTVSQNSQVVSGPHTTPVNGILNLNLLPVGGLTFRLEKIITLPDGSTPEHILMNKNVDIGPGMNSKTLVFPESLIVYKFDLIHELTHIEDEYFGVPVNYSYANSEEAIKALLQSWNTNLPNNVAENLARLILVEKMVQDLFDDATATGIESMQDLGDLIGFIFYADDWGGNIIRLLIALIKAVFGDTSALANELLMLFMKEIIKMEILAGISEAIDQVAALFPDPGPEIIRTCWNLVKAQYGGLMFGSPFGGDSWEEAKQTVFEILEHPFFQLIYIDLLSSSTLDAAKTHSENLNYNGDFHEAHLEEFEFVADKQNELELLTDVAGGFRVAANLFMVTANIFDWLGALVPGAVGAFLEQVTFWSKIGAYATVVTAFGVAVGGFFSTPTDMEDKVDDIYLPGNTFIAKGISGHVIYPRSKISNEQLVHLKNTLYQSVACYDSMVVEIKQNLQNGNSIEAVRQLKDLQQSETQLKNSYKATAAPIYSVAYQAKDSIASFTEMYDSLRNYGAYAVEDRILNYIYVVGGAIDSSQQVQNMVFAQLDQAVQLNHQYADQISLTLDTVTAHLEIPAVVMVNYTYQEKLKLEKEESSTISVKVKNVGSLTAEQISIVLETNDALAISGQDSIYLGSLDPGEESDLYSWTVSVFNQQNPDGIWDVLVYSSNAKTYSASGAIGIAQAETPATGGKLTNENIYNYPNPVNPDKETTTLRYSLEKSADVSIKIYDAGGNLVRLLLDGVPQAALEEQSVEWDGKNGDGKIVANGVYHFVIETSQDERAVGKIAVLR